MSRRRIAIFSAHSDRSGRRRHRVQSAVIENCAAYGQLAASIPATALFPVLLLFLIRLRGGLEISALLLMLWGTQWYLLFNVMAGAMAVATDLKEVACIFCFTTWDRWRYLTLAVIFPYLITGMITAWGASPGFTTLLFPTAESKRSRLLASGFGPYAAIGSSQGAAALQAKRVAALSDDRVEFLQRYGHRSSPTCKARISTWRKF